MLNVFAVVSWGVTQNAWAGPRGCCQPGGAQADQRAMVNGRTMMQATAWPGSRQERCTGDVQEKAGEELQGWRVWRLRHQSTPNTTAPTPSKAKMPYWKRCRILNIQSKLRAPK